MATYNLSQGVEDSFEFTMKDPKNGLLLRYLFHYPSAADLAPNKDLDAKIDTLKEQLDADGTTLSQKKDIQREIDDLDKEKVKAFYKLIVPVDHDVAIDDLLDRVNVVVVRNFNEMVKREFAA